MNRIFFKAYFLYALVAILGAFITTFIGVKPPAAISFAAAQILSFPVAIMVFRQVEKGKNK